MAVVVVFKPHLRHRLRGTGSVFGSTGVALDEMTVSKTVLSKKFDVLEDRAVVECVTSSVTRKAQTSGVKRLSSAKGIHVFVCWVSMMFKAIRDSDRMRIFDIAVCIGDFDVIDLANDGICCFWLCRRGVLAARAR